MNVLIDYLLLKKEISERAYTICERANIDSQSDLNAFLSKHGSFYIVRGCGKKTNKELLELCNKNFDFLFDSQIEPFYLTDREFEREVEVLFNKILGKRAKDALLDYFGDDFVMSKIESRIIKMDLKPYMFINVGKKTFLDIVNFKVEVLKLYSRTF